MGLLTTFFRRENIIEATAQLLALANVNVTGTTLEKDLHNHPDYPSLLSVSDVFKSYGVNNIAVKTSTEKLSSLPFPCLAPIRINSHEEKLTVLREFNNGIFRYLNPESLREEQIPADEFKSKWKSGTVLLIDADDARGENDYYQKRSAEKLSSAKRVALVLIFPLLILVSCVALLFRYDLAISIMPAAFSLITLAGLLTTGLLIWYELDQYNPVAQKICKAGKKVNCGAILNSKAAQIAGISWSVIGLTYFAGSNILLLVTAMFNPQTLFTLSWLNLLALPYILFSVYYQWKVAGQWCILCLAVQSVLLLQGIVAFAAGWHQASDSSHVLTYPFITTFILSFSVPAVALGFLLPAYKKAKAGKSDKAELNRLKHNIQIFDALLAKQKSVSENPEGLGITLGNPAAKHKIIKVCNPYCGPCAEAHAPMEQLVHANPDIQVQIIFTASNVSGDNGAAPVKHFLAIKEKYGTELTSQALDDWYNAPKKDYDAFAAKYAMNGELAKQSSKIDAMRAWCDTTQISFTPTFFVNGQQLPDMYTVNDLKYFLTA